MIADIILQVPVFSRITRQLNLKKLLNTKYINTKFCNSINSKIILFVSELKVTIKVYIKYISKSRLNSLHKNILKGLFDNEFIKKTSLKNYNKLLKLACKNGHTEIVECLLKYGAKPSISNNYPIGIASQYGHNDIIKILLQKEGVNPAASNHYSFRAACSGGHVETVKLLLQDKRVNPEASENHAIRIACEKGYLEIVKILLQDERADPAYYLNTPLLLAEQNGHGEVFEVLLKDPRVERRYF